MKINHTMKKLLPLFFFLVVSIGAFAQFGTFKKKTEIESFKDTKLIAVLYEDSAYSVALMDAIEMYWKFTPYEFAEDFEMKKFAKGNYAFLTFSKSRVSKKNKSKLGSCEEDFNGLIISRKYKRRVAKDDIIAKAFCRNDIDTVDWQSEMVRGVQMLGNYFYVASEAKNDKGMSSNLMMNDYPSNKSLFVDNTLLLEQKTLDLKGKEDAEKLFGAPVEESGLDEIQKAILNQDTKYAYFFTSKDEKNCHKLVVSAQNSEVIYYSQAKLDKCKCDAKDLAALKNIKIRESRKKK